MGGIADCFPEETKKLKKALMSNDWATSAQILRRLKQADIPLNIGITGEAGSGKSSFINAFRGIDDRDERAAPTGCIETTSDIKPYLHPFYSHVTLWDLPGVGTTRFPAEDYLEGFGFSKFDFFIIVSDTRLRENDVKLAKAIQKMGKKFYFVRSKMDNDIRAERRSRASFSVDKTLEKIKQDCAQGLRSHEFESPPVFLMSSFFVHMYDFSLLHETFKRELPALKRHVLLFSVDVIHQEIINIKKRAFCKKIKYKAAISAAGAAVPLPGLSVAVDVGLLVKAVTDYTADFGLDASSLKRLATDMRVTYEDLKRVIRSPLTGVKINGDLILKVLSQLSVVAALVTVEEGFCFIPIVGTIFAVSLSSYTTFRVLNHFLDVLSDDAKQVFRRALCLPASI